MDYQSNNVVRLDNEQIINDYYKNPDKPDEKVIEQYYHKYMEKQEPYNNQIKQLFNFIDIDGKCIVHEFPRNK